MRANGIKLIPAADTLIEGTMLTVQNKHKYQKNRLNPRQKRSGLPHLAIRKIFDLGIQACDVKDTVKVYNVINTLKGLTGCQYKGWASGYYRLYDYCLQFVKDKRFDKARDILYELHQSWNVVVVTDLNDTGLSAKLKY